MLLTINPYTDHAFFCYQFSELVDLTTGVFFVFEHQVSAFLLPLTGNSRELLLD